MMLPCHLLLGNRLFLNPIGPSLPDFLQYCLRPCQFLIVLQVDNFHHPVLMQTQFLLGYLLLHLVHRDLEICDNLGLCDIVLLPLLRYQRRDFLQHHYCENCACHDYKDQPPQMLYLDQNLQLLQLNQRILLNR